MSHPVLPGSLKQIQRRLNLIRTHSDLSSPENIEAGVYAAFGGKDVCLANKKVAREAATWIKYLNESILSIKTIQNANNN